MPAGRIPSTGQIVNGQSPLGSQYKITKSTRKVTITVSNNIIGHYEARSYPHDDFNGNGKIELYKVPLYEISISGNYKNGLKKTFTHKAPRFMPYWNNPNAPSSHYKTTGWINSGLSEGRTITVRKYISDYQVQNRFSPGKGAIVLKDYFYIHAGPASESDVGFGSAGCIEIIGNWDIFKEQIALLSGSKSLFADIAITQLILDSNLIVIIHSANVPDIRRLYTREI